MQIKRRGAGSAASLPTPDREAIAIEIACLLKLDIAVPSADISTSRTAETYALSPQMALCQANSSNISESSAERVDLRDSCVEWNSYWPKR